MTTVTIEEVRRSINAERWLVARLVASLLDTKAEVTSSEVVDAWERIGVCWTDRRSAFSRVDCELRAMWAAGVLCSDELRQVVSGGLLCRIYRRSA